MGLLLHLQNVKSRFVLWQPRYNLLTEEKDKKIYIFKHSLLENILLLSILRNSLEEPSLDPEYTCGKLDLVKFNCFNERSSKLKKGF